MHVAKNSKIMVLASLAFTLCCCLSGCNQPKVFTTTTSLKESADNNYYQCEYAMVDSAELFRVKECWGERDSKGSNASHITFSLADDAAFDELNFNRDWHSDTTGIYGLSPVCSISPPPTHCVFTFSTADRNLPDTFSLSIFPGPDTSYVLTNRLTKLAFKKIRSL